MIEGVIVRMPEATTGKPSSLWGVGRWAAIPGALAAATLGLSACSSGQSVTGTVNGQNYSASSGQLPSGFPSDVPTPSNSRVLGGGGSSNNWDVAFAVQGPVSTAASSYQSKVTSAGYAVSNSQSAAAGAAAGATFTATSSKWMLQVASGSGSTTPTNSALKPGEVVLNLVVTPATGAASP